MTKRYSELGVRTVQISLTEDSEVVVIEHSSGVSHKPLDLRCDESSLNARIGEELQRNGSTLRVRCEQVLLDAGFVWSSANPDGASPCETIACEAAKMAPVER